MERGGGNRDTGRSGVPLFVWSGERVDIERRALIDDCELRLEDDGRKLSGVALRFNVRASDRPERFAPGAFDLEGADVILGSGHPASERAIARTGGGLELSADDHALRFRAVLPDTALAREAVELVKARIFRNVSVEFKAIRERMIVGVREIQKAILVGLVVLPRGSYSTSEVDARTQIGWRRGRVWLQSRLLSWRPLSGLMLP